MVERVCRGLGWRAPSAAGRRASARCLECPKAGGAASAAAQRMSSRSPLAAGAGPHSLPEPRLFLVARAGLAAASIRPLRSWWAPRPRRPKRPSVSRLHHPALRIPARLQPPLPQPGAGRGLRRGRAGRAGPDPAEGRAGRAGAQASSETDAGGGAAGRRENRQTGPGDVAPGARRRGAAGRCPRSGARRAPAGRVFRPSRAERGALGEARRSVGRVLAGGEPAPARGRPSGPGGVAPVLPAAFVGAGAALVGLADAAEVASRLPFRPGPSLVRRRRPAGKTKQGCPSAGVGAARLEIGLNRRLLTQSRCVLDQRRRLLARNRGLLRQKHCILSQIRCFLARNRGFLSSNRQHLADNCRFLTANRLFLGTSRDVSRPGDRDS